MLQKLQEFQVKMANEKGQGLVEYALIIALVSIVVIAALTLVGTNVTAIFNSIAGTLGLA